MEKQAVVIEGKTPDLDGRGVGVHIRPDGEIVAKKPESTPSQ